MKISKFSIFVYAIAFSLLSVTVAQAATSPSLGAADTYSVLSGTGATNTGATTITGNLGVSPAASYTDAGTTTFTLPGNPKFPPTSDAAQLANTAAFGALSAAPNATCDTTYAGTKDLVGLSLVPGIYCADAFALSGTLTLDDTGAPNGVWIFRSAAALNTSAGVGAKVQFLTGVGLSCNVWWKVVSSATIGVGTTFVGNILASTAVALQTGATLNGRAFAQTAAVTMDANTISGPTCAAAPIPPATSGSPVLLGSINVIKLVINDNGRTKKISDFSLFVSTTSGYITPVTSGATNIYSASRNGLVYAITETKDPNYTQTFSGDCDASGKLTLLAGDNKTCIVTNNDIGAPLATPPVPPLIDVVKVPNPLSLPLGPGSVQYTYTVRNMGTVPMTDVTLVGDTCFPIVLASGDTNTDNKLDVTETWKFNCSVVLTETRTNTVVATGWANGLSAVDLASATVIVGLPIVPPLIHITKVPWPFTLSAGGGSVTYTKRVTNPGTVPLSNVTVTDDKCNPLTYISGDINGDSKLDPTESWKYTCKTNLTKTTTNTAVATGEANGLTVRDFALATVVVSSVPTLPNTGFVHNTPWSIIISGILALFSTSFIVVLKRRTN